MVFEGRIVDVMESWPLQLTVATEGGRCHVALLQETMITRNDRKIGPGELTPGLLVRVEGPSSSATGLAMTAQTIQILE